METGLENLIVDQTQGTSVECFVCVGIKSEAPDGMHKLFFMVTNHNTTVDTLLTGLIDPC